jgi:serine/threonine-protein kinase
MKTGFTDIPGFLIGEKLGESALTEVWSARQDALQRQVNLRLLKPEFPADSPEAKRFVAEAKVAASLRHAHILDIYNLETHGDVCYIVMESIDGPRVQDLLDEDGNLPARKASSIARRVAMALSYAWSNVGLIHRTISPNCIRLGTDGSPKLAYLGLALRVDPLHPERQRAPDAIEGWPYYVSPEQAQGELDLDCRTDMYSLGATLYHMVTGRKPFGEYSPEDAARQHVSGQLPNPRRINADVPPGMVRVIEKLMMKRREDRYADWDKAITEMTMVSAGRLLVRRTSLSGESTIGSVSARRPIRRPRVIRQPGRAERETSTGAKRQVRVRVARPGDKKASSLARHRKRHLTVISGKRRFA